MKIGICAPSASFTREDAEKVTRLAAEQHPSAELVFHDQCFAAAGHFAGSDAQRLSAFVEMANNPALDAVWFARGGYGACRIAGDAVAQLNDGAKAKTYMGYSDAGNMLGALYKAGIGRPAHGPMPADIRRDGGDAAIIRALNWLVGHDVGGLEAGVIPAQAAAAFNLTTLAMMVGTPIMPDLYGHMLLIEDVSEYHYTIDRAMFHISSHLADAGLTGIRLGRVSDVIENDRPFGEDITEIIERWCTRSGIEFCGRADIGHDTENKIVPFGRME